MKGEGSGRTDGIRSALLRRVVVAALLCLLLATCTTRNREPGYVYFRIGHNPTTLDPALIVDVNGGLIAAKLFNGLVKLGDGLEVVPDIAESWEVSNDALRYRFTLRRGVTFSSGRKVRAADFKYSFERVLDPEARSPNTWIFEKIRGAREFMEEEADEVRGIRVVDDHTLEIRLEKPFAPFLGLMTMPTAYVVPVEEVLHWGPDFSSNPVGTGPFVLIEWLPNRHLALDARKDYFDLPARVTGIVYRVIPEELTAVAEFELGNLDVITVPSFEYSRYQESPRWKGLIASTEALNTYYLGLNCERPPFDDPELRRAVNRAIDRRKILETLYEKRGRLAPGPVPDALRKWPEPEGYRYEPERAREYVRAQGLSEREITFYVNADQAVVDMAEVIQAYLKDVGLRVSIRQLEWSAFKEAVGTGEADMFWLSWWADYPDPENFLYPLFHSSNHGPAGNRARYTNPEVDKLIERGQHAPSPERSHEYYEKAEHIIARDAPWVFFWHRTDYTVRQPWIKHYRQYPVYSMDKGVDLKL
jgi:peptide/nickel transport system substrate-binding protein/oligopeptide transport system substrate-binding protein